jgi:AraC-like DNA-binding protein
MASFLDAVKHWPLLAKQCGYKVGRVARKLDASDRSVERYFKERFGKTPHQAFAEWRIETIRLLARSGANGQKIARKLGFGGIGNLCRSVKNTSGYTLRQLRKRPRPLPTRRSRKGR